MNWSAPCEEDSPSSDVVRLVLIVGMGTTVCLVGIFLNTFLLLSFFRLPSLHSDILYLFLLAAFDIMVEICFMLIFPTSLLWDYFRMTILYDYWHHYIRYVSTAGQVLIAASTLLIVVASFERYICSLRSSVGFSPLQRYAALGVVFLASIVMKAVHFKHLPSILKTKGEASITRRRKRDATRTLAALVSIYLLTNTLNLLITIMEFIEPDILRSMGDGWTYKYLADLSSLLTISSTATRLPVYLHCNGAIREQIRHFFHSCANQRKEKMMVVDL
uniref:G_PROTEIN_RECEP_F1_2 domain-containing protein n=1 Tax=Heterorhabditis bacteriophora TaxID=37862 RepID=A0A1I7WN22_HETBA